MPDPSIDAIRAEAFRNLAIRNLANENPALSNLAIRNFTVDMQGVNLPRPQEETLNNSVKTKIMEAALASVRESPGFNPAALSVVFGLKW